MLQLKKFSLRQLGKFLVWDLVFWGMLVLIGIFVWTLGYSSLCAPAVIVLIALRFVMGVSLKNRAILFYLGRTTPLRKPSLQEQINLTDYRNVLFPSQGVSGKGTMWMFQPVQLTFQLRPDLREDECIEYSKAKMDYLSSTPGTAFYIQDKAIFVSMVLIALSIYAIMQANFRFAGIVSLGILVPLSLLTNDFLQAIHLFQFIDQVSAE